MNRGTSQGKSSVVNGSIKFMCEVKWTLSLGTKVGKRVVKNPFDNTFKQIHIQDKQSSGTRKQKTLSNFNDSNFKI